MTTMPGNCPIEASMARTEENNFEVRHEAEAQATLTSTTLCKCAPFIRPSRGLGLLALFGPCISFKPNDNAKGPHLQSLLLYTSRKGTPLWPPETDVLQHFTINPSLTLRFGSPP